MNNEYHNFFDWFIKDKNTEWRFGGIIFGFVIVSVVSGYIGRSLLVGVACFLLLLWTLSTTLVDGAIYLQDLYEFHDFAKAHNYLIGALFGFNRPSLKIMSGMKDMESGEINTLEKIGGPGKLEIEPGNAVVLETLIAPTRILGAGRHLVERGEMIKEIIALGEYYVKIDSLTSTTRDGIEVMVSDLEFRFCFIQSKQEDNLRSLRNPFPFSRQAISNMVYGRTVNEKGKVGSWTDAVQGTVKGIVLEHINNHDLDSLLSPDGQSQHPLYLLREHFSTPTVLDKIKSSGARLLWVNVGDFSVVSKEINEQRLRLWLVRKSGDEVILHAQGEAEKFASRERGRAESQAVLLRSVAQALQEVNVNSKHDKATTAKNLWNIVLARTAQILESMSSTHDNNQERK